MKVRCVRLLDARGMPVERSSWLKVGSIYPVLTISTEPGQTRFRILGEEPIPALFDPAMFEVVSSVIPDAWAITMPRPGCISLAPEPWSRPGFWELFYDGDPAARACFEEERARIIASDP